CEELHDIAALPRPRAVDAEEDPDEDQDQRGHVEEYRELPGGDGVTDPFVPPAQPGEYVADALEREGNEDQVEACEDQHERGGGGGNRQVDGPKEEENQPERSNDLAPHPGILELPSDRAVQGFGARRLPHVHPTDMVHS